MANRNRSPQYVPKGQPDQGKTLSDEALEVARKFTTAREQADALILAKGGEVPRLLDFWEYFYRNKHQGYDSERSVARWGRLR